MVKSAVCLYAMTPDTDFIVDRHPALPQVAIGAGFSGHGFKFAPAIGELLADLVADPVAESIPRLRLSRFERAGMADSTQTRVARVILSIAWRLRFPDDSLDVDPGRRRVDRRRRSQRRDRVLRKRSFRPITVCLAPFIDDAPQILIAGDEPRCRGLAGAAAVRHLAQTLAQVPDEGRKLVLVKVRGERKDAAISRLQKSHDAVHEPVVVSLLRIDLRHTSPLAA